MQELVDHSTDYESYSEDEAPFFAMKSETSDDSIKSISTLDESEGITPYYRNATFWVACIIMTCVGAINPIISKSGFLQETYPCSPEDDCEMQLYNGFMAITILKYFWQACTGSFIFHVIDKRLLKKPFFATQEDIRRSSGYGWNEYKYFVLTAFFDSGFTVMERSATAFTRASVIAAIASIQVMVAALADLIINKRAVMVVEIFGLVVITIGLIFYCFGTLASSGDDDSQAVNPTLGVLLAAGSSVCRGIHSGLQGKYMARYMMPPLKALYIESLISLCIVSVLTLIFDLAGMIDSVEEFWMVVRNWRVMMSVQSFAILCIGFNGGAAVVGKFVSALFRILLTRLSGVLSWSIEIALGWTKYDTRTLFGWSFILFGTSIFAALLPKRWRAKSLFIPILCGKLRPPPNAYVTENQKIKLDVKGLHQTHV